MLHETGNMDFLLVLISPHQCKAARGLFAMTRQELSNASGVSVRTITSHEDVTSDRVPTQANLAAIVAAFHDLGVVFNGDGVGWRPTPFLSGSRTEAIKVLSVRHGPKMATVADVMAQSGCSRGDLDTLVRLQIVSGVDGLPILTPIGLHIPGLLRDYEDWKAARHVKYGPVSYDVFEDEKAVFHAFSGAVFKIEDDGTLTLRQPTCVQTDEIEDVTAGAIEALRRARERDPRIVVGRFAWAG
jgi:hypothetical protein